MSTQIIILISKVFFKSFKLGCYAHRLETKAQLLIFRRSSPIFSDPTFSFFPNEHSLKLCGIIKGAQNRTPTSGH